MTRSTWGPGVGCHGVQHFGDKAADTMFLALPRPRFGTLYPPTTSTEKLGAVAASVLLLRWQLHRGIAGRLLCQWWYQQQRGLL